MPISTLGLVGEFARLFELTGLFQILRPKGPAPLPPTGQVAQIAGFDGINIGYWRQLGGDSLTTLRLIRKEPNHPAQLELRTADLNQRRRVLGRSYQVRSIAEVELALKRYLDQLLVAYTGRPGFLNQRILFVGRKTKESEKQIYTVEIDGTNLRQVTSTKATHLAPAWDRCSERIFYTSYEQGNPDLYMLNLKSLQKVRVAGNRGLNSGPEVAPNNKMALYTGSVAGDANIYALDFSQLKRRRFTVISDRGLDVDPAISPDGKWLAYVSGRFGNPHIFRRDLTWHNSGTQVSTSNEKRLTFAGWYNATPAWSPDSRKIAFAGFDREVNRFDMFLMNADGTQLERLTIHAGDNESPTWSANGQLIVFHSNRTSRRGIKGTDQLFLMNRDGSDQRRIPLPLYDAQTPRWEPIYDPNVCPNVTS
jgi:TolB protein